MISRGSHMEIYSKRQEEMVPSTPHSLVVQRETVDHVAPVDVPRDIVLGRKRHAWARQTLKEAKGHATPHGTFQERKIPQRYS
jgi:hypothetical protein